MSAPAPVIALTHGLAAFACLAGALWLLRTGARRPHAAALFACALSAVLIAALGPLSPAAMLGESLRNAALLFLIFSLLSSDDRDARLRLVRPVIIALLLAEALQPLILLAEQNGSSGPAQSTSALLRMLVSAGVLFLLHNLYAGAAHATRVVLRRGVGGLVLFWGFELNAHTIAYLSGSEPVWLAAVRGLVLAVLALCLLPRDTRAEPAQFEPSRTVALRTASLLLVGAYLLAMVAISDALGMIDGGAGRLGQVSFVIAALAFALVWLPSRRLREWMQAMLARHFFRHRYDYRDEWLRFTGTIARAEQAGEPLRERSVRALAQITGSMGGVLLCPDQEGSLVVETRWQWPVEDQSFLTGSPELAAWLEREGRVLAIDDPAICAAPDMASGPGHGWLAQLQGAWAVVPLLHFERLVGVAVLAPPLLERRLDWEDVDLLQIAGRQVASYLAEQDSQRALLEANRFEEFNRRIAFVMHDIKNLASQLSLLAGNAEKHADKPAFREDMLVTLRNSASKLTALLSRLDRYGAQRELMREPVDLLNVCRAVSQRHASGAVQLARADRCHVTGDGAAFEQAIGHLVQNAVEASEPGHPVHLSLATDGLQAVIEIVDTGCGMEPSFVKDGLFKPFVSSKEGGFGIGAFEARELIRALGGSLSIDSRVGLGTRFTIRFPLAATDRMIPPSPHRKVA